MWPPGNNWTFFPNQNRRGMCFPLTGTTISARNLDKRVLTFFESFFFHFQFFFGKFSIFLDFTLVSSKTNFPFPRREKLFSKFQVLYTGNPAQSLSTRTVTILLCPWQISFVSILLQSALLTRHCYRNEKSAPVRAVIDTFLPWHRQKYTQDHLHIRSDRQKRNHSPFWLHRIIRKTFGRRLVLPRATVRSTTYLPSCIFQCVSASCWSTNLDKITPTLI